MLLVHEWSIYQYQHQPQKSHIGQSLVFTIYSLLAQIRAISLHGMEIESETLQLSTSLLNELLRITIHITMNLECLHPKRTSYC